MTSGPLHLLALNITFLISTGREQFNLDLEFRIVVDEDGVEIDEEYVSVLPDVTQLMVLNIDDRWFHEKGFYIFLAHLV